MSIISSLSAARLSLDPVSDFRQLTAFPFMVNALEAGTVVGDLGRRRRLVHGSAA